VLGSLRRLIIKIVEQVSYTSISRPNSCSQSISRARQDVNSGRSLPLNTGQDCSHIIGRAPPILQDIQAELTSTVDIRVKHLANELDAWRLVGVLLFEVHNEAEGAIFERSVCGANDDGIPTAKDA
jgi:hypothetical protein